MPKIPGIKHAISSNEAFYLPEFPREVTVIGGGYIAVEFASIFAGLGAKTTLLYRGEMFLGGFDDSIDTFVKDEIEKEFSFLKPRPLIFINSMTAHHTDLTNGEKLTVNTVLCATGRIKNPRHWVRAARVALGDNGEVLINDDYQTNVPNIYAIGDIPDRIQLTPVAIEEAMCLSSTSSRIGQTPCGLSRTLPLPFISAQ